MTKFEFHFILRKCHSQLIPLMPSWTSTANFYWKVSGWKTISSLLVWPGDNYEFGHPQEGLTLRTVQGRVPALLPDVPSMPQLTGSVGVPLFWLSRTEAGGGLLPALHTATGAVPSLSARGLGVCCSSLRTLGQCELSREFTQQGEFSISLGIWAVVKIKRTLVCLHRHPPRNRGTKRI